MTDQKQRLNLVCFVTNKRDIDFVKKCADEFFRARLPERNPHISFDAFMQGVEFAMRER